MHVDLTSFALGAGSVILALVLCAVARALQRRHRRRARVLQRRREAIARQARHDEYKSRVRFVPDDNTDRKEATPWP